MSVTDQDQERQEGHKDRRKAGLFLRLRVDLNIAVDQVFGDVRALGPDRHIVLTIIAPEQDAFAVERDRRDISVINCIYKV